MADGLADTAGKHAARLRATIVEEINQGKFRFAEHFPDYKNLAVAQPATDEESRLFQDWAKVWGRLSARGLEHSSHLVYLRHLAAYWLPVFGHLPPERITHVMVLERLADLSAPRLDEKTGKKRRALARKTQNNILIPLRGVFELICKARSDVLNPTDGIDNQKVQKAMPGPFSPNEVEAILRALEEQAGSAWANYFEFSFFAGFRASEQIALLWEDVDHRSRTAPVWRTRVLTKDKDRTKTNVERQVELNDRAYNAIRRQRARTEATGREVFWNPNTGKPFVDEQSQRRVWRAALRKAGVRYRAPKECRDTSVTLALMAGANPMWVALQHGHSVQVMMRDYAKWIPSADRGANRAAVNAAISGPAQDQKKAI
ncbi:tyrosine-type recombinase/integrase [Paracidovorax citrulli]|nr:tyrosine-type recombinase/integrase [Paracidovorax citrulli]UEG48390.1 tyrosine-type recombinase/integrase [Paracidovorax citrulli]WIY36943.1 tyrosine-type recombinase/integrase [Paracidovorax citrulli]